MMMRVKNKLFNHHMHAMSTNKIPSRIYVHITLTFHNYTPQRPLRALLIGYGFNDFMNAHNMLAKV